MNDLKFFEEVFKSLGEPVEQTGEYAVLALIVMYMGEPSILFEVRGMELRRQPGEVCFPGGRIEAGETAVQCAVREAGEELGISRDRIRIIGSLGPIYSLLNERIPIYVGIIEAFDYNEMNLNPEEVHKVFIAPFEFFMKKGAQEAFNFEGHYIWGLTARGVNKLVKLCREGS